MSVKLQVKLRIWQDFIKNLNLNWIGFCRQRERQGGRVREMNDGSITSHVVNLKWHQGNINHLNPWVIADGASTRICMHLTLFWTPQITARITHLYLKKKKRCFPALTARRVQFNLNQKQLQIISWEQMVFCLKNCVFQAFLDCLALFSPPALVILLLLLFLPQLLVISF